MASYIIPAPHLSPEYLLPSTKTQAFTAVCNSVLCTNSSVLLPFALCCSLCMPFLSLFYIYNFSSISLSIHPFHGKLHDYVFLEVCATTSCPICMQLELLGFFHIFAIALKDFINIECIYPQPFKLIFVLGAYAKMWYY